MREDLNRILDHLEVSATPQPILLGDLGFIISLLLSQPVSPNAAYSLQPFIPYPS